MGINVVIPVAGVGTRLRPYTWSVPKVLVPVAGRPMLGHILEELKNYDVDEVTLILGYYGDKVREYVSENFPFKFRFIEQETMEGLGHAIWMSAPGYRDGDSPVLVILGDTLFEADFSSILGSKENWLGVSEVEDARRFGVVMLEGDKIVKLLEKPDDPPTNLAVVGIYYFADSKLLYECLDTIVESDQRTKGEIQLTDAMDMMLQKGAVMKPFEISAWLDCGKAETLLDTNQKMLELLTREKKLETPSFPGSVIVPPVAIGKDAEIKNSVIGPNVSLGKNVKVTDSIIKNSIGGDEVVIAGANLEASIMADRSSVQADPKQVNLGDLAEVNL